MKGVLKLQCSHAGGCTAHGICPHSFAHDMSAIEKTKLSCIDSHLCAYTGLTVKCVAKKRVHKST